MHAATAFLGIAALLAATGCGGNDSGAQEESWPPTVIAKIDTGQPVGLAAGFGSVWVADHREGTVSRIDPDTNEVVERIQLGSFPADLAAGEGGVWVPVLEGFRLSRVDPRTNRETASFPGVYTAAATGAGSVWALHYEGGGRDWGGDWRGHTVVRIDPRRNRISKRIRLPHVLQNRAIAFGAGAAWVVEAPDTVVRIDARTNDVAAQIRVGGQLDGVAVGEGAVWIALTDGHIARVDPETNRVTARIRTGTRVEYLAAGEGSVWAGNVNDIVNSTLSEIDPHTNRVAHTLPICDAPQGVLVAFGDVWVACFEESQVWRIRP